MLEPGGVLGDIIARKRSDLASRFAGDGADMRARAQPTTRSLAAALSRHGARFILELKRASPSAGALRQNADPSALARGYANVADAMSVLTDGPFFGGSLADLAAARAAFDGPILAKDFVIDVRQIAEARLHGADAILVMLSVLDDAEARGMIAEAARLNMDALVEVHDEREVQRAIALGAKLVGVNNRDLKSLRVDLAVTERLAPMIPPGRIVIAESGVSSRADVERLAPHADAFLVGSALMRAPSPAQAARTLAFGRVKVCGLTSPADAAAAAAAGATHAGIVMAPGTPRAVDTQDAHAILAAASDAGAARVAVFRDADVRAVAADARALALDAVQLHGAESAAYIGALRGLVPESTEIWAACPVAAAAPPQRSGADRTLFDTQINGQSGGTGRAFDWSKITGRAELSEAILAGGLNPQNARAAACVGAYALDVGSGVESAPRRKDKTKLRDFFEALRAPTRGERVPC